MLALLLAPAQVLAPLLWFSLRAFPLELGVIVEGDAEPGLDWGRARAPAGGGTASNRPSRRHHCDGSPGAKVKPAALFYKVIGVLAALQVAPLYC